MSVLSIVEWVHGIYENLWKVFEVTESEKVDEVIRFLTGQFKVLGKEGGADYTKRTLEYEPFRKHFSENSLRYIRTAMVKVWKEAR